MTIGLKTVWTLRIAPRHQSTVHGLTTRMNSNAVQLKIILCDACTVREIFRPLICFHVTINSIQEFQSNRIVTPHQSMPHHRSMPRHRSVYVNSVVNSVVNSNIDSTVPVNSSVYVNSAIFPFILLLRFSTVLSSKVMSVLPSDLSFIVK